MHFARTCQAELLLQISLQCLRIDFDLMPIQKFLLRRVELVRKKYFFGKIFEEEWKMEGTLN